MDTKEPKEEATGTSVKEGVGGTRIFMSETQSTKGSQDARSLATIYPSCEAANDALGPCPRALAGSDGGHWWYIDHEAEEAKFSKAAKAEVFDYIECECKSCPQKMRLSADAEEYPI